MEVPLVDFTRALDECVKASRGPPMEEERP
jgi:hypothetical protein